MGNLNAAGFKAGDIDTVVLKHYHGDHINGVRKKAGHMVFPRAKIMVPMVEHAFWMDDAHMAAVPEAMKGAFMNVCRVFGGMGAEQLVQFVPGSDIISGVTGIKAMAAFGHTPGHTLVVAQSYRHKFACVADLTNVPALFARNPDMAVQFDMDAEAAREARLKVFNMLVDAKMMAGGFHFPFPAFGRIEKIGNGFDFKPVA